MDLINFTRGPSNPRGHGMSRPDLNHRIASQDPHSNSESDPDPDPDPDPNTNTSSTQQRASAENPHVASRLEEHAIISAHRRKLPTASEEDVLHAARVFSRDLSSLYTFTGVVQLSAEERSIEMYSMLAAIKCRLDQFSTERSEEQDNGKLPQQLKAQRVSTTFPDTSH